MNGTNAYVQTPNERVQARSTAISCYAMASTTADSPPADSTHTALPGHCMKPSAP